MATKKNPKHLTAMEGLNPTQRKSIGAMNYTPREKQEGEAGQRAINLMTLPAYDPAKHNNNGLVRTV